tara:strand:- start:255 stop:1028 length:774 start_codon:yes stop_codon:yes gene_type:complete
LGYRKNIVRQNIKLAFKGISNKKLRQIEKKFYTHFCDITLEALKSLKMSEKEMKERFVFKNIEVLKQFEEKNQSIIIIMGHYSSWEWMLSLGYYMSFKGYGIYTPLMNKYLNQLVQKIRKKHHGYLISRYSAIETMKKKDKEGELAFYGFASDQSPRPKPNIYWRNFLGVKVPVFMGAELIARELNFAIVYARVNRIRRGYYEAEFELLTENPRKTKEYEITDIFTTWLEKDIYNDPTQYLWTHNRFKHRHKIPRKD